MNKSQTIYFDTTKTGVDMNVKIRLEQDIDTLEFMSMQLTTEEIYQDFNSDYGVLVGKVTANGGVGIPNAKISIFIPLSDADADMGQITSIYPYKTPRDKNFEGKRYNLLPRVSKIDPNTNQLVPKQAFGSFPIKEEVVTNTLIMDVYKKYYKYTALTNNSGDYMIFGVPVGTQIVHMSVDITDIGEYSMNPAAMVTNLGYSPNLFMDNNSKIKPSADLGDLPNIETQEISVDIIPFWGDTANFEIGITRQDFRIRATLVNTITIFGSVFTDGTDSMWGENVDTTSNLDRTIRELYHAKNPSEAVVSIATKRSAKVTEKIYYYPANISDDEIDSGAATANPDNMLLLSPSQYSVYKRDGDFVFILNANRNKITTDENGNKIPISNDSPDGVFTQFRGFITLEITKDDAPMTATGSIGKNTNLIPYRYKLKFPQYAVSDYSFNKPDYSNHNNIIGTELNEAWSRQNYTFNAGKFYSVSRFHGLTYNNADGDDGANSDDRQYLTSDGFLDPDNLNNAVIDHNWNVNVIVASGTTDNFDSYPNASQQFPSNGTVNGLYYFGANWLNLSVHLPQLGYMTEGYSHIRNNRTADNFSRQYSNNSTTAGSDYFLVDNLMPIAAYDYNTKWFARSDLHWTDFIEVSINDIVTLGQQNKGFKYDPTTNNLLDASKYRNGTNIPTGWSAPCPLLNGEPLSIGGQLGGYPHSPDVVPDPNIYFYRGVGDADCIKFLKDLGLIN